MRFDKVPEHVTRAMRSNKSSGTKPETQLCSALWRSGVRGYRRNYRMAAGTPDVYFTRAKVAVFVNGCFWHSCPHCRPRVPKTNTEFWSEKFARNRERDARVRKILKAEGRKVVTVWECMLKSSVKRQVRRVIRALAPPAGIEPATT